MGLEGGGGRVFSVRDLLQFIRSCHISLKYGPTPILPTPNMECWRLVIKGTHPRESTGRTAGIISCWRPQNANGAAKAKVTVQISKKTPDPKCLLYWVFNRAYKLVIQSVMLVFSTQLVN